MTNNQEITSNYIPQSNYRNSSNKSLTKINTDIPALGKSTPHKELIINKINYYATLIHEMVTTKKETNTSLVSNIKKQLFSDVEPSSLSTFEEQWKLIQTAVLNIIKVHYLTHHINELLATFNQRVLFLLNKYKRHLPSHISLVEGEDLNTIAQLELIETFKAWNPSKNEDLWPLAYTRINGAMKDHIRYISKSDPSRFYDWVTDAAQLYLSINEDNSHELKIENSSDLSTALKVLNEKEKKVVILYIKDDMTFSDIGKKIHLSESQVSRIYKKAVEKIKGILKPNDKSK